MAARSPEPGGGEVTLRPMTAADVPTVAAIERQSYPAAQAWSEGIFRDCLRVGYLCRVLEVDGVLAGYGILSVAAGEAHLLNVCASPAFRGRGIGRLLVEHFLDLADRYKAHTVYLEVRPSNTVARALYESLGFRRVGVRKSYYPAAPGEVREDALQLARDIA
ncbi:ribosomal protein S18-alanine N-acetyltransferase [Immundisolibacter sp.]|uniref:ribosomal protein S18-alanine N-acetyltransferase n=1 Tax=Immundisolibacter sp. TaxID=1934948 RepID=UPI00260DB762|nr:ribosomal protein S18-alanine N-acetyltransferase [Immundisolibacter sp.]MDD3652448.1 ribosomal protein S18-alanine N-acetyltransferase [Immundisolibacter sp.]